MNKLNIPATYNSGTSSETSETPSIDENPPSESITPGSATPPIQISGSKIPKTWKRMKDSITEGEAKRPPWRAVSISTLPKPDKNALLRAKLLDASRRLRKLTVGIQTDIVPTKLMKDVAVGPQTDLVLCKEVGILTDGLYAQRRDGSEQYILTYSIAQMTDKIELVTVSTQTLVPRFPGDAFLEAYTKRRSPSDQNLLQRCSETEKQLLKQLAKLRKSTIPLTAHFQDNIFDAKTAYDNENNDSPTVADTAQPEISQGTNANDSLCFNVYHPKLLYPTELSWHFEYDMDLMHNSNSISTYTITANKPWDSFIPLTSSQNQNVDFNFLLLSIDELINESNRLADFIENIMKKRIPTSDLIVVNAKSYKSNDLIATVPKSPSEYWLPIIEDQEKCLSKLKMFSGADVRKLEEYNQNLRLIDQSD